MGRGPFGWLLVALVLEVLLDLGSELINIRVHPGANNLGCLAEPSVPFNIIVQVLVD